ncbi:Tubulin-tyrosine ligase family protein [Tritrichomonas foetus]|uniref:Tubulin-tyrosine ligase family protein n=1 Tax=Tritrichomonas foetus TaxID=1144522 RepID=A0A1J4JXE0_9EUKA|nr:Tubulin-tyrosine ligase family protein [Tritrichomonas foetus]|eukprot:OHT03330.1 Tubulin-tyrosine ligase family protein [Tritrichomonas foetus]
MATICASLGQMKFRAIKEALHDARIPYDDINPISILVWHDGLKDADYFSRLMPWQVVNRIPGINILCRKTPMSHLLARIQIAFPELYNFVPRSFILPQQNQEFVATLKQTKKKYLIKPDMGSLGQGISIIEPGEEYKLTEELAVAQEYVESYLINNTKFDLRVYVLLCSIKPLRIFVFRDGLARFCSEEYNSESKYAQLTNVSLNRDNPEMEIARISQLISEIFPKMAQNGIDIDELWFKIENVIALTILSAYGGLKMAEQWQCPAVGYPRCFQILGFDILLDPDLNPTVLEVNYRPNLDYYRGKERRMKVRMIKEAIQIAVPYIKAQDIVLAKKWEMNGNLFKSTLFSNPKILKSAFKERKKVLDKSLFSQVWPSDDPRREIWKDVINYITSIPIESLPGLKIPHSYSEALANEANDEAEK